MHHLPDMALSEAFETLNEIFEHYQSESRASFVPLPFGNSDSAEIRRRNVGRWIAWTRGFGKAVASGESREEVRNNAAQAGYGDVVCEWVPPTPDTSSMGRP
jgi:hypothetical protein